MNPKEQLQMAAWVRAKYDFAGSLYREPCPTCGAEPFCYCVDGHGKSRKGYPHTARRGAGAPALAHRGYHRSLGGAV